MELNRIEQTYRHLVGQGRSITKMFSGNPSEQGITFPGEVLSALYLAYFQDQHYTPDPQGYAKAREAVANYYDKSGGAVDPARVLLTAGTSESFSYLCWLLCQPGDQILLPAPGYPLFAEVAALHDVEPVYYPLQEKMDWQIDCDALAAAITPRTKALVVISPHNPTGMVVRVDTWTALAQLADRHRLPLVVDEVFADFFYEAGPFPRAMAANPAACFTLNGISKMCALPGLKLGWIAATGTDPRLPGWIDRLAHIADAFLTCHEPIQRGLHRLLEHTPPFLAGYRTTLAQRRAIALAALRLSRAIHSIPPAGGFYLTARIDTKKWRDEEELICTLLTQHGIFFHPGYFFDMPDGVHVICSLLTKPDDLTRGIQALLELL